MHLTNNTSIYDLVLATWSNGDLQLIGGSNYRTGRVEIFNESSNTWGIVCDDGWDDIDAGVVCRQLGFGNTGTAIQTFPSPVSNSVTPILLDDVNCNGQESRLIDCEHTENHNCQHFEDAGVQCSGAIGKNVFGFLLCLVLFIISLSHCIIAKTRLVNGPTKYEGRVEVNYNGVWGTVCDDGWDLNDVQVVCSELDLGKAVAAIHGAFYGQGSGQIWLDDVNCFGIEETIKNCSHGEWGSHNCYHGEDASVKCTTGNF